MKIRNLMAPVVALAVCGTVATVQAQQPTPTGRGEQNQSSQDTNRYQNQDSSQNRLGANQQNSARQHVDQLLEGITLTAQQRTKIDSIVQKFSSAQQGGMNQGSVTEEPQDTVGRRSDTTTATQSTQSTPRSDTSTSTSTYGGQTGVQPATQVFSQLDAQVRAVLTPEQQNIWDRNVGTLRNQGNPKR